MLPRARLARLHAGASRLWMLEREEIAGARASKRRESPAASYWSSDVECKASLTYVGLRRAEVDRLNKIAVSDQGTIEGLTQFLTQSLDARPQITEDKSIRGTQDLKEGFALHCSGLLATR